MTCNILCVVQFIIGFYSIMKVMRIHVVEETRALLIAEQKNND
jgi:hypothetical protein